MKNFLNWVFAATLICGSMLFTACSNNDNPTPTPPPSPTDIDLKDPLTIEATENGEINLYLNVDLSEPIYYSVNGGEKQVVNVLDVEKGVKYTTVTVKTGDKVQVFSRNNTMMQDYVHGEGFEIFFDTECYVYGYVMSLISPDDNWKDNREIKKPYALASLLSHTNIVTHPTRRLMLPATKLSKSCYTHMFDNSEIEVAPELPATTLAESCYEARLL